MTVNITSSKTCYYFNELIDNSVESQPILPLSDRIPSEWVQAGFCNEQGVLQFAENLSVEFDNELLEPLLDKLIFIDNEKIPLRFYLNKLSEVFSMFSKVVYLRGSYATYLLELERQLKLLIKHFNESHPDKQILMEAGLAKLNLGQQNPKEPDDIDFAIAFEGSIDNVDWIKEQIILLNSRLGKIEFHDAKERTFTNLFQARKNDWCQLEDQIVIASLYGETKIDLTIGYMEVAPYLFTMDNHAMVRKGTKWSLGAVAKMPSPWQSFVDKAIGIVRIESRHKLDFRALLRAIILLTNGAIWDSSPRVVADYLTPYLELAMKQLNNPPDLLNRGFDQLIHQLTLKLKDPRVKKLSFIINFLSLVTDPKLRQTIWESLVDPWFSEYTRNYEEAASQIAQQKKAFPTLFGELTLLTIPANQELPAPSLAFMKQTLLMELPAPEETCSGIYAEWRRGCYQIQTGGRVPDEFIQSLCSMYLHGHLDEELQKNLAQKLNAPSLLEAFIKVSNQPEIIEQWLSLHKELPWLDKLPLLGKHLRTDLFKTILNQIDDKDAFFQAAIQLGLIQLNTKTKGIFEDHILKSSDKQAVEFLNKLGPRIKAEKKDRIIELWIFAFKNQKLELAQLQENVAKWLSSDRIPRGIRGKIALTLFQRLGTAPFEQYTPANFLEFFGAATIREKQSLFLLLLKSDTQNAIRFFAIYEPELRPQLQSLFDLALRNQLGPQFISLFSNEEALQDVFYNSLVKIPESNRLDCVRKLPKESQLSVADHPKILNPADRNTLRSDLLREIKSILLLWRWQRDNTVFSDKIIHIVETAFSGVQRLQISDNELAILIREGSFNKVATLLPKLDDETKKSLTVKLHIEFAAAFEQGDLDRIRQISSQAALMKGMPIPPRLNVDNSQLPALLQMIKDEKQSILKSRYCETYATLSASAAENSEFCDQLFSLLPHFPWRNYTLLFIKAVTAHPRELHGKFKSIEAELLTIDAIPGELSCAYFTSLYNAKLPLPAALPSQLFTELTLNPALLVSSIFIAALLRYDSDREFQQLLIQKLIETNDTDVFTEWFAACFRKLQPDSQTSILQKLKQSPILSESVLKQSRTTPGMFGDQVDAFVSIYISIQKSQNDPSCFCCVQHLPITDLRIINAFIESEEEFVRNAPNILEFLDKLEEREHSNNLRLDISILLESMIKKAIALDVCELFEGDYDLIHAFQNTINLKPIGRKLFERQLTIEVIDPYWLSYAETLDEIVKALEKISSLSKEAINDGVRDDVLDKLTILAADNMEKSAVAPEEADLDQFFNLVDVFFPDWLAEAKIDLLEKIKKLILSEEKPAPVRTRAIVFYLKYREDNDENSLCQKACELLGSNFNFEYFRLLFLHCLSNRPRFRATFSQLTALIEKKSECFPQDVQQFIRRLVQLEFNERNNSEQELFDVLPLAKKMQIDLDEPLVISYYLKSFFAHRLIDIAMNNPKDFSKKLYEYALKISATLPNQPLAEAIPVTLGRLVELVVGNCSEENSSEFSGVLQCLSAFVKDKLLTLYKNNPEHSARIGKKIIFSAFIHPCFFSTDVKDNLWFFVDLPITSQEMVMIRSCITIIPKNSGTPTQEVIEKYAKFPTDPVTQKTVHIWCYEMAVNKKTRQDFAWILGFFHLLFSAQTDLEFLKLSLPAQLTLSKSRDDFKKRIYKVLFDLPNVKKDKVKSFMETLDKVQPMENLDKIRLPLTVKDLEDLSLKIQEMNIMISLPPPLMK